jgi:hypothetical protein
MVTSVARDVSGRLVFGTAPFTFLVHLFLRAASMCWVMPDSYVSPSLD